MPMVSESRSYNSKVLYSNEFWMTSIKRPYKIKTTNNMILLILKSEAYAKNDITKKAKTWRNLSWIKIFAVDASIEIKLNIDVNTIVNRNTNLI